MGIVYLIIYRIYISHFCLVVQYKYISLYGTYMLQVRGATLFSPLALAILALAPALAEISALSPTLVSVPRVLPPLPSLCLSLT